MILKDKNYRITNQRKIILEELKKVYSHPTASEIYEMIKKKYPKIGLATVYRSLDFLEKRNLILKLKSKEKEARYDGNPIKHCHLICEKCKEIIDLFDVENIIIKSKKLQSLDFDIRSEFMEIHGVCKKCQVNNKKNINS